MRCWEVACACLLTACFYSDYELPATTQLKCDPDNPCPPDYYCSGGTSAAGTCFMQGTVGCEDQPLSRRYWGFHESSEGWDFLIDPRIVSGGVAGMMTWTGSRGEPELGANEMVFVRGVVPDGTRLGWFICPDIQGDMRGAVVSARVWTNKVGLIAMMYVANFNNGMGWTDGGGFYLRANDWVCVSLAIDQPAYTDGTLDPMNVPGLGIQILGALDGNEPDPTVIVIDDVGY